MATSPFSSRRSRHPILLLATVVVFLASSSSSSLVHAQTTKFIPRPVHDMAYATVEGKQLLIHGGSLSGATRTDQFFALDLTHNWNADDPPWVAMPMGVNNTAQSSPVDYAHSATVSRDQDQLFILGYYTGNGKANYRFNLKTNTWEAPLQNQANMQGFNDLKMVTDTNTGRIYIPSAMGQSQMAAYNLADNTAESIGAPLSQGWMQDLRRYNVAWSSKRASVLVFGGGPVGSAMDILFEYSTKTFSWTSVARQGNFPAAVVTGCFVPALGGSVMVLFGGTLPTGPSRSIYILDLDSMVWTKGPDAPETWARTRMACTSAGDSFVAVGGMGVDDQRDLFRFMTPSIYNLKTNNWTDVFSLGEQTKPEVTVPDPGNGGGGGPSAAAIGGGAGGATVVLLLFFAFMYRRRKLKMRRAGASKDDEGTFSGAGPSGSASSDGLESHFGSEKTKSGGPFQVNVREKGDQGALDSSDPPFEYVDIHPRVHNPHGPVPSPAGGNPHMYLEPNTRIDGGVPVLMRPNDPQLYPQQGSMVIS